MSLTVVEIGGNSRPLGSNPLSDAARSSVRIPELDGIRGLAIALVVAYHYFFLIIASRPNSALSYTLVIGRLTWTGVDLFFVLSGFLIGGILLDARNSSNYFRVFYTRRFYRIIPLYAVWLLLVSLTLTAMKFGLVRDSTWLLKDSLPMYPYLFFLQNFWMAAHNSLGGATSGGTWSLAIEEQFYLTLPLIIRFFNLARMPLAILIGVIAAPVTRILLFLHSPHNSVAPFVLMPCRADALLLGVFAAVVIRNDPWKQWLQRNQRFLSLLLSVFLAGAAFLTIRVRDMYGFAMISVGYTWMAALYACVLLFAVTQPQTRLAGFMRWKYLTWLGTIAYGVYLVHGYVRPLLFYAVGLRGSLDIVDSIPKLLVSFAAIPVTLLICRLSWLYFETPLMRRGHRTRYILKRPT